MSELAKRATAAIIAVLILVGLTSFTTWGFDPASWPIEGRLAFGALTIWAALFAFACPIWRR